jgi:beta-galactosidase beta subunit
LLDKLQENLENYKTYSEGLKETINKIIEIDSKEIAAGDDFIQKAKLTAIVVLMRVTISVLKKYTRNYHTVKR